MRWNYENPAWDGYLADPFVFRTGSVWYAFGTGGPESGGLQPDGRLFPLLRSKDLARWEHLGGSLLPLESGGPAYWAPEAAERDGRYYLYYSNGGPEGEGHALRMAAADRPEGPYLDSGRVLFPDEPFTIDASPFCDPRDGRWYLFFARDYFDNPAGTGLAVAPLDEDMVPITSETRTVFRGSADWHLFARNRRWYGRTWPVWHTAEGPFAVERRGKYICFYSGGRWDSERYGVGALIAESPLGPWREIEGATGPAVLAARAGSPRGPGHNSVTVAPDGRSQVFVYHAWDDAWTIRRMYLDPLIWTADGPRCDGPTSGRRSVELE